MRLLIRGLIMFRLDDAYRRLDAAQSFKDVFAICEFINEGKHQLSRMDEHAFYFTAAIRLIQLSAPSGVVAEGLDG